MDKAIGYLRILFHILTLLIIILSLYPGSILGFLFYGSFEYYPQISRNFLYISTNHFYAYFLLSILGFFSYLKDEKFKLIIIYLFFLSFFLEILHFVIPERFFEIPDLLSNILGVLIAYMVVLTYNFLKNK